IQSRRVEIREAESLRAQYRGRRVHRRYRDRRAPGEDSCDRTAAHGLSPHPHSGWNRAVGAKGITPERLECRGRSAAAESLSLLDGASMAPGAGAAQDVDLSSV